LKNQNRLFRIGLALLTGVMNTVVFPNYNLFVFVWIGFIPLLIAVEHASRKEAYWLGVLSGTVSICGAFPWLIYLGKTFMMISFPFNYFFWLGFGFFSAQLLGIVFFLFILFQHHTKLPSIFLFPLIMVTVWSIFPNIFYFTLANGTSNFPIALQATEYTGNFGLDFVIILANYAIYQLIRSYNGIKNKIPLAFSLAIICLWFVYGGYSLNEWDKKIAEWQTKRIGLVQPNRIPSFAPPQSRPGDTYKERLEMHMSKKLAAQEPEIIVWPEGNVFGYMVKPEIQLIFSEFVKQMGIPIVFHESFGHMEGGRNIYRNASIWINENGQKAGVHFKRLLVPFGEYTPLIGTNQKWVRRLNLPPSITPGEKESLFKIAGMNIVPLICYEIQFSRFVAESIRMNTKGNVFLVQSNDGWYGKGAQSAQHRTSNILRAVENRVPVIHVINNGASSIALPNGRYLFVSDTWVKDGWVVDMPYDDQSTGSFYSRYPLLFLSVVRVIFGMIAIYLLITNKSKIYKLVFNRSINKGRM